MHRAFIDFLIVAMILGSVGKTQNFSSSEKIFLLKKLPEIADINIRENIFTKGNNSLPQISDKFDWPRLTDPNSLGVEVTAKSAVIIDKESGKILFEKDIDTLRPLASITKLMTALVFLESSSNLENEIVIMDDDRTPIDGVIFRRGEKITYHDALFAALLPSANDAARVLVRASGVDYDTFIHRMNEKARELGMEKTRFFDPTGIDSRNVSTAREISLLIGVSEEIPLLREITQTKKYTIPNFNRTLQLENTNELLESFLNNNQYKIILGKTGSLPGIGYNFALSVDNGNKGVIVVALGSSDHFSRFQDIKSMAYWAFTKWQWRSEVAKR